jgi:hypothetical protein
VELEQEKAERRLSPGCGDYRVTIVDDRPEGHGVIKVFGTYRSR